MILKRNYSEITQKAITWKLLMRPYSIYTALMNTHKLQNFVTVKLITN